MIDIKEIAKDIANSITNIDCAAELIEDGIRNFLISATQDTYNVKALQYIQNTSTLTEEVKQILDTFIDLIRQRHTDNKVLDVGFGSCRDMMYFEENEIEAVGIDTSEQFISRAKELCKVYLMDMRRMTFPLSSFSGIWALGSAIHVRKKDIVEVLSSFHKVLKQDGVLGISVKLGVSEGYEVNNDAIIGCPVYVTRYGKDEINHYIEETGFKIVTTITSGKWYTIYASKV
jgi:SAM-dependent methyltransferase